MTTRKKAAKGSLILASSGLVSNAASFLRNMILARLLTKADFGIAVTFSLVITLFELTAKLGISRFVVQDKEGNAPEFIATTHLVQFCAALLSALLILLAAPVLAAAFAIPQHTWAIRALALLTMFRGFEHIDVRRFDRELRFGPAAWVETVPQLIITLLAWPLGVWLGDFRVVLILLITKSALSCVMSHILAERPYAWRYDQTLIRRMLLFGWPLLVNGFLMFGVLQGDQFLLATFYSMTELAPYAAAAGLVMAPTLFFGGVFGSIILSVLAQVQEDPIAFERRYRQILAIIVLFSGVTASGLIVGAEALMSVVFGSKYSGTGLILGWLAAANAFRNLRIAPTGVALARGDSQNQMIATFCRATSLIPVWFLAQAHMPIWTLATCGLLGEAFACLASFVRLRKRNNISIRQAVVQSFILLAIVAVSGAVGWSASHSLPPVLGLAAALVAAVLVGFALALGQKELRIELEGAWNVYRIHGAAQALRKLAGASPTPLKAAS